MEAAIFMQPVFDVVGRDVPNDLTHRLLLYSLYLFSHISTLFQPNNVTTSVLVIFHIYQYKHTFFYVIDLMNFCIKDNSA